LSSGPENPNLPWIVALKQGLRENALIEGKDYIFDARWAGGDYERFSGFARELVEQNAAVIIVSTIAAAHAAQRATTTIPIVKAAINDPVGSGLIASLSRPGGNITGMATLNQDITSKMIEILHTTLPKATNLLVLFNSANPSNLIYLERTRLQAEKIGVEVRAIDFKVTSWREPTSGALKTKSADAMLVIADAALIDFGDQIVALGLEHRTPVISASPDITAAGGLISYGISRREVYRRSAYFVKKVLDGAKPADLPIEQPTRIMLSLNLKTARALGIAISDALLVRADEVIE
jgi:putative ABC transport system substrate-binding protein